MLAVTGRAAPGWADPEAGLPVIERYPPQVYHGYYEINDLTVDRLGRIYGSSQLSVIRFDGTRWERLAFPSLWARRVTADDEGRIYVSGDDQLGYYAEAADGSTAFKSLLDQVPAAALPLGIIRGNRAVGTTVAFAASKGWLVYHDGAFVFTPVPRMGPGATAIFKAGNTLYASAEGYGLHRWRGQNWEPLPLPLEDAARTFTALTSLPDGALLAIASTGVALRIADDGHTVTPFPGPGGKILGDARATQLLALPDGRIAANTRQHGVLLVSPDGSGFLRIDRATGLGDNTSYGLTLDHDGGLWVGSTAGFSRLDLASGVTVFDERNGPTPGALRGFSRHDGRFFAMVVEGLHRLQPAALAEGKHARFEPVPGSPAPLTDLGSHPDGLLVVKAHQLWQLRTDGAFRLVHTADSDLIYLFTTARYPDLVLTNSRSGTALATLSGGIFTPQSEISETGTIDIVKSLSDGALLIGSRGQGFWKIYPGEKGWSTPRIIRQGSSEGLPPTKLWTAPFILRTGVRYHTADGTWLFDESRQRFQLDPAFLDGERRRYAYPGNTDSRGRHWASGGFVDAPLERQLGWYEFSTAEKPRWHPVAPNLQSLVGNLGPLFVTIDPARETEPVLWAKSTHSILRLEANVLADPPHRAWQPLLRSVAAAGVHQPLQPGAPPRFAFSREGVAFAFASGQLALGAVKFQTRLVGFTDTWSDPSERADITYNNLSGGPFTLEIRAIDSTGRTSEVTRYTFSVAPPWHLENWAFALYALLGGGAILGFVRWRGARAEREQRRLEALVAERTRDLATARDQAEAASRAKSAFLAAMSHELRTPLNGVIGYAQLLQADSRLGKEQRERVRIVHQSGEHLLRMINDVLDLAKIEAGKLELRTAPFALAELVNDVAIAHAPAATAKRLVFHHELAADLPVWV